MPLNEKQFDFYFEEVCTHADEVLRFAYFILLNREAAWACVSKTFDTLIGRLASLEEDLIFQMLATCWKTLKKEEFPEIDQGGFAEAFSKLSVEERSAMAGVDILGLLPEEAAKVLDRSYEQIRSDLSNARQKLLRVDFA